MRRDARLELLHRQRVPAVRRVREVLRAAIVAGHYADGLLPREDLLIAQFGVSPAERHDGAHDEVTSWVSSAGSAVLPTQQLIHTVEIDANVL
jgi:hypothetical protein